MCSLVFGCCSRKQSPSPETDMYCLIVCVLCQFCVVCTNSSVLCVLVVLYNSGLMTGLKSPSIMMGNPGRL